MLAAPNGRHRRRRRPAEGECADGPLGTVAIACARYRLSAPAFVTPHAAGVAVTPRRNWLGLFHFGIVSLRDWCTGAVGSLIWQPGAVSAPSPAPRKANRKDCSPPRLPS